jgi:transposase-like protein
MRGAGTGHGATIVKTRTKRTVTKDPNAMPPEASVSSTSAETPSERGRPGKRGIEEKRQAVLDLLAGEATVEQLAKRLAVLPETIEGWRAEALAAIAGALRQKPQASERERQLERDKESLERVVTKLVMKAELLERAMEMRRNPSRPGRS